MPVSRLRKGRKKYQSPSRVNQNNMSAKANISKRRADLSNLGPISETVIKSSFYQGIVPSPEMMSDYKAVDPNLPMELLNLTKSEGEHRRKTETTLVRQAHQSVIIGQILAFLSVIVICGLAYAFMINEYPDQGKYIVISTIIGVAALFLGKKIISGKDSSKP